MPPWDSANKKTITRVAFWPWPRTISQNEPPFFVSLPSHRYFFLVTENRLTQCL
jgi:hypothetical protein